MLWILSWYENSLYSLVCPQTLLKDHRGKSWPQTDQRSLLECWWIQSELVAKLCSKDGISKVELGISTELSDEVLNSFQGQSIESVEFQYWGGLRDEPSGPGWSSCRSKVTLWFSILSVPSRSANSTLVSHSGEGNASMGRDRFLKPYGPESRMRSSDELQCHKLKEMFKIRDAAITFFLIPIRYRSLILKLGQVRGLFF